MSTTQKYYIRMAILVLVFYLGLTYLPQIMGTCLDGECGFSVGELVVSFAIPLAFIALPIVLEMVFFRKGLSQVLSDIGITRFSWTGIHIAVIYLIPLIIFFPVIALLTNSAVALRPHWAWMLLKIILINGFAEEIMMRGFVFRHLREGRTFWRAASLATLYFVVYHFPLLLSEGVVVGIMAIIVAIPLGYLTAYSYERGSNTVWGPVVLHVGMNALAMLPSFNADIQPVISLLYLLTGIVVSGFITVRAYLSGYGRSSTQAVVGPHTAGV